MPTHPGVSSGSFPLIKVMLERIRSKLTAEEEKCVKWSNKSNNEDILDAIGIGLWHFGRLNQKVYPRAGK